MVLNTKEVGTRPTSSLSDYVESLLWCFFLTTTVFSFEWRLHSCEGFAGFHRLLDEMHVSGWHVVIEMGLHILGHACALYDPT